MGWLHTHDEVREALRYTALGATVLYRHAGRVKGLDTLSASREFTVVLDAAPTFTPNTTDFYCLPCLAEPLISRVKELCDRATAALQPLTINSKDFSNGR